MKKKGKMATCLILLVLLLAVLVVLTKKNSTAGGNVPDSILRDSVLNMNIPMLICERTSEKIIWYNKAAGLLGDGNPLFGEKFAKLFGIFSSSTARPSSPATSARSVPCPFPVARKEP